LLLSALLTIVFATQSWRHHRLHGFTTLLLLATVGLTGAYLWLVAPAGQMRAEPDYSIYPHVFLLFIGLAAILAYAARLLARWLMHDFRRRFGPAWANAELLRQAELFVLLPSLRDARDELRDSLRLLLRRQPERICYTIRHNLRSAIATPLRYPHLLLFPIAVAVLLFPSAYMYFAAVTAGLFAWTVLALAGNYARLNNVLNWLQRLFFHGVLWGVSILVIILAACRLWDFSYVATITNSASNLTVVWFLLSIYATLWYYKYWIGHVLGEHMLDLLPSDQPQKGQLTYRIAEGHRENPYVLATDRYVQVHGMRFVAVGTFQNKSKPGHGQAWEFYDQFGLFEAIAQKQPSAPSGNPKMICKPGDPEVIDGKFGLSDLRQRVQVYYVLLDLLVVIALVVFGLVASRSKVVAELEASKQPEKPFALSDYLFQEKPGDHERKAVVLFAASGGGTRAALYAASVLRGLHEYGALEDVKLCSGVSGGSTAIAHLAIHRAPLQGDPAAWKEYAEVMSAPFIDDVLCGTLEWRIACGTRIGTLLDESFHRQMYRAKKVPLGKGLTLKDAELGVIFNTTLAGTELPGKTPDPTQAGSRLIITNLRIDHDTFPAPEEQFPGVQTEFLHHVVVNDPDVQLTTGAALSANFPPVFPNAAVDIKTGPDAGRYWVTDGGAAENRGAISLLYILLHTLREEANKKAGQRKPLPIQIVIAEASAVSLDFSEDRGVGSALGASEKFASQLAQELLKQIEAEYKRLKGEAVGTKHLKDEELGVHFLPMPLVLRSGAVGTHWKLPAYLTLTNPKDKKHTLILSDSQTRQLIMDLYLPDGERYLDTAKGNEKKLLDEAWKWIEGTEADERFRQHRENWTRLRDTFSKLGYQAKRR
jgi:hypothetical protein